MKTSIIISTIAALSLLITFAEVPHRHRNDNMNIASDHNTILVESEHRVSMLPGVVITPNTKNADKIDISAIPAEDLSYLKFDVTNFMQSENLFETVEIDFSYLKFDVNNFISNLEESNEEMMPLGKNDTNTIVTPIPAINSFDYLRFDVTKFINHEEIEEIPL